MATAFLTTDAAGTGANPTVMLNGRDMSIVTCKVAAIVLAGRADVKQLVHTCGDLPATLAARIVAVMDIASPADAALDQVASKVCGGCGCGCDGCGGCDG